MSVEVERARAEARAARADMLATVDTLKQRLAPRTIAEDVWDGVLDRSSQIAEDAVELALAKPKATAAVAAGAVMFAARNPIKHALAGLFGRRRKTDDDASPPLDGV